MFWDIHAGMLGLYAHVACLLCELYLECGCHIFTDMSHVYSDPYCIVVASDFICGIYVHTSPI